MKENTKKYLIIAALFIAVFALVTAKNMMQQKQMAELPDDGIVGGGQPVLLELGSHGCKPCNAMMPILIDLSRTQSDFGVAFVDVKAVDGKSKQYGIELIPTQIFFDPAGIELYRHTGFFAKDEILAKWSELLNESGPGLPGQ